MQLRADIGGAVVNTDARAVGKRLFDFRQKRRLNGEKGRREESVLRDENLPPPEVCTLDPGEVEARPLAGRGLPPLLAMHFDATDTDLASFGQERQPVVHGDPPAVERPRHDRAEPLDREGAVEKEARRPLLARRPVHAASRLRESGLQLRNPRAGHRRDGDDRRAFEESPLHEFADLLLDERAGRGVDEVALRPGDDPRRHVEEREDGEVLARLRHDGVVGGDGEEDEIHALRAGHHRPDELLVAGHVDEREDDAVPRRVGEAEVDGDAALLLLGETVGIGAGQGFHQRALAVVDVPGGADENARTVHARYSREAMKDDAPRETEVKFRLPDRAAFELRLLSFGARCEGRERERNVLFDDVSGTLRQRGNALRLRTTEKGALLTYKGKASFARGVKTRLELESGVEAPERIAALLVEIGFAPRFTYDKRRTTWRFLDPERPVVVVDETPLGLFAELEGDDKAVRILAEELGVPESAFIPESYVALWMKAREEDPALPRDMVFPNAAPAG